MDEALAARPGRLRLPAVAAVAAAGLFVAALAGSLLLSVAPAIARQWFGESAAALGPWLLGVQGAAAAALVAVLLRGLTAARREARNAAVRGARLQEGIESLSVGIAVWDAHDRLIACNEAFRALYPEIREHIVPGATYVDLSRRYYEHAPADAIAGRSLDEFLADGQRRRRGGQPDVVRPQGGRWLLMTDRPTAGGGVVSFRMDVTDREAAHARLRRSEERFRALTALATEWYWETDAALNITVLHGPPTLEAALQAAFLGRPLKWYAEHPRYRIDWALIGGFLERREAFRRVPFRYLHRDGSVGYFECSAEPIFDGGAFVGYRGLAWDVTERETLIAQLTESEARFRALTELSSDWYWEMDEQYRFTSIRQGPVRSLPVPESELLGRRRWDLPGDPIKPATWDEHRADLEARRPFRDLIVRRFLPDGTAVFTLTAGDPIFDDGGNFIGYRGIGKNITEQVRAQERIERLATLDPLTQLPNRQTFDERAGRILADAYAHGRSCALLFVDLDNFRLLNNGYGHRVGDQVLATVAARIKAALGEPHLVGRRGGDELVALLVDLPRAEAAVETARTLIAAIAEPARVLGMEVSVTPSIGIAFFPQDGVDLDSLLNAADAAMYQAKENGRRTYALYTPTVARRVDLRLRLEQRLRKAVETRDFKLFYQPLVSMADGKMIGAECLVRWKDAELGEISPAEFIPIAEESGLIIGLGDWVVREACRARQVWRSLGLDVPPLAINVSGVQLRQLGCVERLLDVLAEFQIAPGEIEVEVTETGLLDTSAVSRENLVRLRNAGVKLALDDFGVGFSSLAHLRDLPIQRLKIDRSFTVECMRDARTLTIVKAVIEMARSLGISVTAEGIETQAQQTWMQHLGCDSAQGFLFARPMPAEEFLKLFLDRRGVGRERSLMH
jgi:diguanylate cyclase (GGDEF)-like protein/PAS domain S-box-containing protein